MRFVQKLYPYQLDVINVTNSNKKGIIVLPTGTGKTFCQAAIIAKDILENPEKHRIYLVNAPRIVLTYQLQKEVFEFLIKNGIEARYLLVHSGSSVDLNELEEIRNYSKAEKVKFSEIESTTSHQKTYEVIKKAKKQNLPIIIFSTYNSSERVEMARNLIGSPLNIVLNDEAHYLVQERFHDILHLLISERCYFFTATTKHTPSEFGRGMNNIDSYGELLYQLTPREAIEMGKMVRPRIHLVKSEGFYGSEDFDKSLNLFIFNSFIQHLQHFEVEHKNLFPKFLISARGSKDILEFINSNEYQNLRNMGVEIFATSSTPVIGNDINGKKVKRQKFLEVLKKFGKDDSKKMIVIHYDILTEGIDIPGFTSWLPLRSLNKGKIIQSWGRTARLDIRDKTRMDNGEIFSEDLEKMFKPFAYIILPLITDTNQDDSEYIRQIVSELRDFGFSPHEDIVGENENFGIDEDTDLDILNQLDRRNQKVGDLIRDVYSEFELEEIAKLSKLEYLQKHLEIK